MAEDEFFCIENCCRLLINIVADKDRRGRLGDNAEKKRAACRTIESLLETLKGNHGDMRVIAELVGAAFNLGTLLGRTIEKTQQTGPARKKKRDNPARAEDELAFKEVVVTVLAGRKSPWDSQEQLADAVQKKGIPLSTRQIGRKLKNVGGIKYK